MGSPDDTTPHDDRIRALERARLADGVATARPAGERGADGHPPADRTRRGAGAALPPGLAAYVRGPEADDAGGSAPESGANSPST